MAMYKLNMLFVLLISFTHRTYGESAVNSLTAQVTEIQTGLNADDCDRQNAQKKFQLAAALDEKQENLETFGDSHVFDNFEIVSFGTTQFRKSTNANEPSTGWIETPTSWTASYKRFEQIRSEPINISWLHLYFDVKALILDDKYRAVNGVNFFLDKDSCTVLDVVRMKSLFFLKSPSSYKLKLTDKEIEFIKSVPRYDSYWSAFGSVQGPKKQLILQDFVKILGVDYDWTCAFAKEATIVRRSKSELVLPLNPGSFSETEAKGLSDIVESTWSSSGLSLKIEWDRSRSNLYEITYESADGNRPRVSRSERKLRLYKNNKLTSIAHEVGHILGFQDYYYESWHPESCEYRYQSNGQDIMSDADTGRVTPDEWKMLDVEYPWNSH